MNLKPLPGQILVLPLEVKMVGLIHVIGADQSALTQEARVMGLGDPAPGEYFQVKLGDRVLIHKRSGRAVTINGQRHLLFKEHEIYAILAE